MHWSGSGPIFDEIGAADGKAPVFADSFFGHEMLYSVPIGQDMVF